MRFMPAILILLATSHVFAQGDVPKASDPRLVVTQFAASPDIVHPIACDFDAKGRLLVVESHTHFAPQGYPGPKFDRIRVVEDTKGTGKADRFTTFFEGTRHTMDIAVHPDGSVYVATRNEILRLRDTTGTGVADEKTRIVFLDTKGDYPHNGLSGLCFDSKGDLYFGMGENLGAAYKLIGSDGQSFAGQGDGGHIFHCRADGKNLRRVATGFWNPFGICRDIFGRVFAVDNDPDQAPPCRMLHVVEGGDYGFRFMYGRSGKHPFQSWHGQLPGTLPMMTGVGEAPCEILSYESDGLPAEYRGQLLVTSWADHRVERYKVVPHGASFKAERLPFVQGGKDFRPTGLCVAPDGSLFVADWVLSNYTLHGKGALWHVRWKDAPKAERPMDPLLSMHRPLREAAAKQLASRDDGRALLHKQMEHVDPRMRAAAATALIDASRRLDLQAFATLSTALRAMATSDREPGLRELAVHALAEAKADVREFLAAAHPAGIRVAAVKALTRRDDFQTLADLLVENDRFVQHAAMTRLAANGMSNPLAYTTSLAEGKSPVGAVLVSRLMGRPSINGNNIPAFYLSFPSEDVKFLAAKWIADEKLSDSRKEIEQAMTAPHLSVRLYLAYATALARLDGQEVSETRLADYFAKRLADDASSPQLRVQLLRQVPTTHKALTVDLLARLAKSADPGLKREAVRALIDHPSRERHEPLLALMRSLKEPASLRGYAMLGIDADAVKSELAGWAEDKKSPLSSDARRALIGIQGVAHKRMIEQDRPHARDLDAWGKRLDGPADAEVGERIFFHPKLGGCSKCHRIDGRGKDVGPDLSGIGRTDRRHILESLLQPSNTVAPHYQVWHLELTSGKTLTGMLLHTHLDEYTYLDAKGGQFKLRTGDIAETRAVPVSIMPDGLVEMMTDQELRDLLAYLQMRK